MNELEDPTPYDMKVTGEIFAHAKILGIDAEKMVEFFATQVEAMLMCPPNFKFGGNRCWILRGYYPGSSMFFKQILINPTSDRMGEGGYYFSKVSSLSVGFRRHTPAHQTFKGNELRKLMSDRMENILLGASHKIEPLIKVKTKMPRCLAPKGMKLFRYKKPKRKACTQN